MSKVTKAFYQENPMSVLAYIGLSIITLGFYTMYYHYQLVGTLKRNEFASADDLLQSWKLYMIATAAAIVLRFMGIVTESESLVALGGLAGLAAVVMMFLFARKVAIAIKEYMDENHNILVSYNAIVLFFFPGVGLCSIINGVNDSVNYYGIDDVPAEA